MTPVTLEMTHWEWHLSLWEWHTCATENHTCPSRNHWKWSLFPQPGTGAECSAFIPKLSQPSSCSGHPGDPREGDPALLLLYWSPWSPQGRRSSSSFALLEHLELPGKEIQLQFCFPRTACSTWSPQGRRSISSSVLLEPLELPEKEIQLQFCFLGTAWSTWQPQGKEIQLQFCFPGAPGTPREGNPAPVLFSWHSLCPRAGLSLQGRQFQPPDGPLNPVLALGHGTSCWGLRDPKSPNGFQPGIPKSSQWSSQSEISGIW